MPTVPFLGAYGDNTGTSLMFRNRIINGDMRIDQRNNGATLTPSSIGANYTLDRWRYYVSQASKISFARSATAPAGFNYSMLCTSTSAYSVTSSDVFQIGQVIEGFNISDANFGSADAKPITLSFWARSSLTGLIGGAIVNGDGTRTYPFSFSISAANTWEYKQVVIPGDTTGTWSKVETAGLRVRFNLGSGSAQLAASGAWVAGDYNGPTGAISIVGTNAATFYFTGVQVELGAQSTPFEQRPIGLESSLCQRYFKKLDNSSYFGVTGGATSPVTIYIFDALNMRSTVALVSTATYRKLASGGVTVLGASSFNIAAGTQAVSYSDTLPSTYQFVSYQFDGCTLSSEL